MNIFRLSLFILGLFTVVSLRTMEQEFSSSEEEPEEMYYDIEEPLFTDASGTNYVGREITIRDENNNRLGRISIRAEKNNHTREMTIRGTIASAGNAKPFSFKEQFSEEELKEAAARRKLEEEAKEESGEEKVVEIEELKKPHEMHYTINFTLEPILTNSRVWIS